MDTSTTIRLIEIGGTYSIGEELWRVMLFENGFVTASHQEMTLTLSLDSFLSVATLIK